MIQQNILNNKTTENGMNKNDGTHNLIFCCTANRGTHFKQDIFVAPIETSAPVNGYSGQLFMNKLLQYLRFDGCLHQTACFISFHRCLLGFRSGPIEGHFSPEFCSQPFLLLAVCFESLSCWGAHELWLRQSFLTLGSTFHSRMPWECLDFIVPCTVSRHPVPDGAKQTLLFESLFFRLWTQNWCALPKSFRGHSPKSIVACQCAF